MLHHLASHVTSVDLRSVARALSELAATTRAFVSRASIEDVSTKYGASAESADLDVEAVVAVMTCNFESITDAAGIPVGACEFEFEVIDARPSDLTCRVTIKRRKDT